MFREMHKRLTYANVTLTVALVFAMSGGAFAASKLLVTSTKQISPKVLKALKGANGKSGLQGPAGPVGPSGPAGKDGAPGAAGEKGTQGERGIQGENGVPGEKGAVGVPGSPWTVGGILPSGKTESGSWNDIGDVTNGKQVFVTLSFLLPVENSGKEPPTGELVFAGQTGTHCTGSASAPTAPEGYLCVYDAAEEEVSGTPSTHVIFDGFSNPEAFISEGVGMRGALLHFETNEVGKGGLPFAIAEGTWAVTAE